MSNPQDLKQALLATLAEKGDYATILKHLDTDEKKEKGDRMYKLIEPISAFADMLTENSKGAFMEELGTRLDTTTKENLEKLSADIDALRTELQEATQSLLSTTKSDLVAEHLTRYQAAETALTDKLMNLAIEVVTAKAEDMFSTIADSARLTEDEIEDIIEQSALSVESQIATVIGDYIAEQGVTVDQINGFADAVRKLLPPDRQVSWSEIVGKPEMSQGGTSAVLVQRMIDKALEGFSSGDALPDQTGNNGKFLTTNGTDPSWASIPGGGDMLASVYDPAGKSEQVLTVGDATDFATAAQGAKADTATQPADIANFETTTQLNTRDTANRSRANHTGTQAASTISDFQATVSANTDVVANTAKVTNATHTGDVTGDTALTIANGVVTEAKLNASVNASLDLADSASQPGHTHVAANVTDFDTAVAANSAVAANTAKVTNATHTGDVTGATALTIADAAVSNAKFRDSVALSVIGRSANSTGDVADIAAATDHHVLRRSGTSIGFGAINLAQANATTGSLPVNRGGTGAATHTSGNYLKGAGTGAITSVTAATLKTELALNNVDNTSDANKPVSTAQQTVLDAKASLTGTEDLSNKNIISPINAQTGTTYTLLATDAGKVVTLTNASAITLTVPDDVFIAGEKVLIVQGGAGSVTITAGAGVTLNTPASVDVEIAEEDGARCLLFTAVDQVTII